MNALLENTFPYAQPGIVGSSHLVDAGVQVHNDIDCRNEDLGGDENDD